MIENNNFDSISAIQNCMRFLGLPVDQLEHSYDFTVIEVNGKSRHGTAGGKFRNDPYSHEGPYLEFDAIRGYGNRHQEFKPRWQKFSFMENQSDSSGVLFVQKAKPKYSFKLEVLKLRKPA